MLRREIASRDGAYRYALLRLWGRGGRRLVFIGLNPSVADGRQDDPTVRRLVDLADDQGCAGLLIVNLFAYRAADPDRLPRAPDPVGQDNDEYILWACRAAADRADKGDGSLVVAGWGAGGILRQRGRQVRAMLGMNGVGLNCWGLCDNGEPMHPLYLPGGARLGRLSDYFPGVPPA